MSSAKNSHPPDASAAPYLARELQKVLFDEAADAIFVFDSNEKLREVNRRGVELTGYSREELLHVPVSGLFGPDVCAAAPVGADSPQTQEPPTQEGHIRRKDGNLLPVEVAVLRVPEAYMLVFARSSSTRTDAVRTECSSERVLRGQTEALMDLVLGGDPSQSSFERALASITETCSEQIGTERVSVWLYDDDFVFLRCVDLYERSRRCHSKGEQLRATDFPAYTSHHQRGRVVVATDVLTDARTKEIPESYFRAHDIRSLLVAPVWHGERIRGVLSFQQTGHRRSFSPDEERFALLMATVVALCLQIDERRQAEETLRAERDFSNSLIQSSPAFFVAIRPDGSTMIMNQSMLHALGYLADEVPGTDYVSTFVPEEDRQAVKAILSALVAKCNPGPSISRVLTKDGRHLRVEWRGSPVFSGNAVEYLLAVGIDISDHTRAEQALKESEAKYRRLVENMQDGFATTDLQGHIQDFNRAFLEMTGYSADELRRLTYQDLTLERWHAVEAHIIESQVLRRGYSDVFEKEYRHKDGTVFPVELRTHLLRDSLGQPAGYWAFVRDITRRRYAEEALRVEREQLLAIFDSINQAIYVSDPRTYEVLFVNTNLKERLGHDPTGSACYREFQGRTSPCDFCTNEIILRRKGQAHIWEFHNQFLNRDYLLTDRIIRWPDGRDVRFELAVDITELKQMEEDQLKLRDQLTQAQKMESVGRLAGGVAHDFNNMLTVILGRTELAIQRVNPSDPLHASLHEIHVAAQRSSDLTRQLLAFARKQIIAPQTLDLNHAVPGLLRMLQRLIGEDIDLVWKPGEDLGLIKMDPSQVDQVLINLCVNARDAIAGVGRVVIETANARFDEVGCAERKTGSPGEYVMLSVSDNGRGMDKETLEHIFEPFFTTKGITESTGLGLATVYGVVMQNNGFVDVRSEPGSGAVFKIYVPRHAAGPVAVREDIPPAPAKRGEETVLLVEDESGVLKMVQMMLTALGYRVLAAHTPSEALRVAEENTGEIHLLMTDVILPEMNGRELGDRLRARYPHMRQLFASGYTADVIGPRGVLEEGVHFVQKPFSMRELAAKVREVLDWDPATS